MVNLNIRKNVSTNVVAFFINIALTFIGYRMVVDKGGTVALGVWSALSAAIFVIRLGDVGMGSSAERHVAMVNGQTDPKKARGYLDTAIVINAFLFIILAFLGWFLLSYKIEWIIPKDKNLQFQALELLPLMLSVFVISNVANVITGGLRGLHLAYQAAYLSIGGTLLQILIVIILVPKLGIAGLAWAQFAQNFLLVIVAWYLFNKHIKQYGVSYSWLPLLGSKKYFKELFSFSLKAQAVNLINGLFEPVSKFLIGHSAGMSMLGLYEIAFKMVQLPRNAVVAGVHSVTPTMTRLLISDKLEAKQLYKKSIKNVLKITSIVLFGVLLVSPLCSLFLFNEIRIELSIIILILIFGFLGNVIGAPAYTLGYSSGKLIGNFLSLTLSIIILVLVFLFMQQLNFSYFYVVSISIAMFVGGVSVRFFNEKILN